MKTDDIVQLCAEDVLAGRKTPAGCAAAFPNVRGLAGDMAAAVLLQRAQSITLPLAAQQRMEKRLRERTRVLRLALPPLARVPARRAPAGVRWAAASAIVATVLAAGAGTAAAATQSMPGELLYGVKRADENAQAFFTPASARAFVYAGLAETRLAEMTVLSERGRLEPSLLTPLADDLVTETAAALALVGDTPAARQAELLNTLVRITDKQQAVLTAVKARAPAEAQAGLDRALQASSQGHEQAVERLEQTGSPTSSPTATATATQPRPEQIEPTAVETHVPPGQTRIPPGQTKVPPGQTKDPPGQTRIPPGQTQVPPRKPTARQSSGRGPGAVAQAPAACEW